MTSRNAQAPTAKPSARRIVPAIPHKFARPRPQDTKPKGTLVDRVETVKEKEKAPAQEDESEKRALAPQEESKDESKKEVATSKDVSNKEVATSKDDGSTKEVAASKDEPKKKVTSKQTVVTPPQSMDRADAEQKHAAANGHVAESQPVPEGHAETEPLGAAKLHQPEEKAKLKEPDEAKTNRAQAKLPKPTPTQLPPPFYPSRSLRQPSPVSSAPVPPPSAFNLAAHHSIRPSTDSLVFGGYGESGTASPAPPQSSDSMFLPPFTSGASMMPPPGHGDYPSFPPQQQPYMDWPPPAHFQSMPFPRPPHMNGFNPMSRSPSQTSSGAIEASASYHSNSGIMTPMHGHDGYNPLPPSRGHHSVSAQPGFLAQSSQPSPPNMETNNLQDMRRYLLDRFGTYDFADYVLEIATNKLLPAHSLLLARSPGLKAMMRLARKDDNLAPHWRLLVPADAYFRDASAFVDAIRTLYGGEQLDPGRFLQDLQFPHPGSKELQAELATRMTYVLSYVTAGITLDIHDIHALGMHIAMRLLRWETLNSVIDFILNSDSTARSSLHDDFHFKQSVAVQHMTQSVIDFIVRNFPLDFALDTTAQQLASIRRLPEQQDTQADASPFPHVRRPSHHRLASIRFGDAPANQEASTVHSALSSVLFSLPSDILQEIFKNSILIERLGGVAVAHHMYALVAEREARRSSALQAHEQFRTSAITNTMLQNLYLEELVESSDQELSGVRLAYRPMKGAAVNGN